MWPFNLLDLFYLYLLLPVVELSWANLIMLFCKGQILRYSLALSIRRNHFRNYLKCFWLKGKSFVILTVIICANSLPHSRTVQRLKTNLNNHHYWLKFENFKNGRNAFFKFRAKKIIQFKKVLSHWKKYFRLKKTLSRNFSKSSANESLSNEVKLFNVETLLEPLYLVVADNTGIRTCVTYMNDICSFRPARPAIHWDVFEGRLHSHMWGAPDA